MFSQSCESVLGPSHIAGKLQKTSAEEDERIPVLPQATMTQRERHSVAPWVEEVLPSTKAAQVFSVAPVSWAKLPVVFVGLKVDLRHPTGAIVGGRQHQPNECLLLHVTVQALSLPQVPPPRVPTALPKPPAPAGCHRWPYDEHLQGTSFTVVLEADPQGLSLVCWGKQGGMRARPGTTRVTETCRIPRGALKVLICGK